MSIQEHHLLYKEVIEAQARDHEPPLHLNEVEMIAINGLLQHTWPESDKDEERRWEIINAHDKLTERSSLDDERDVLLNKLLRSLMCDEQG